MYVFFGSFLYRLENVQIALSVIYYMYMLLGCEKKKNGGIMSILMLENKINEINEKLLKPSTPFKMIKMTCSDRVQQLSEKNSEENSLNSLYN